MDEDGRDSIRIKLFWYVNKIILRWNVVQSWIVDILELYGIWTLLRIFCFLSYIEGQTC